MKLSHFFMATALLLCGAACSSDDPKDQPDEPGGDSPNETPAVSKSTAETNTERAVAIIDTAVANYFDGQSMKMARKYNPFTGNRSGETGSVWMYTSSIEAVNAAMKAMQDLKKAGKPELYDANWQRYKTLLGNLVENLEYYAGTYSLTSYTGTANWTVYAVNRAAGKGGADVTGVLNVYDDQEWLVRELLEAYTTTGESKYLDKAEYLTSYVLDGWDRTLDANGEEHGGITWGPGYVTKHSCSNGPMISPLVWLSELYKGKGEQITYKKIAADNQRYEVTENKSDFYLEMAEKIYNWQKSRLYSSNDGVYWDMCGADGGIDYETIDGVRYRKHNNDTGAVGQFYSYNTGTMLSGAAALAGATGNPDYSADATSLTSTSFSHFAKLGTTLSGYYSFDLTGFSPWFNGVLMRGYAEAYSICSVADSCLEAYQNNLDYGYEHFLEDGLLPVNLLAGWNRDHSKCDTEAMFEFCYAAEYAVLASHEIKKK